MTKTINVSFKENELWMYDIISSHSSKGAFIKDVLSQSLRKDNSEHVIVENKQEHIVQKKDINMENFLDF